MSLSTNIIKSIRTRILGLIVISSLVQVSCFGDGGAGTTSQDVEFLYPPVMRSLIYSSQEYIIELPVVNGQVINWISLEQGISDNEYFAITKVSFNGRDYTPPSTSASTVIETFTIRPPITGRPVSKRDVLLITMRYAPSTPVRGVDDLHTTRLQVHHDGGVGAKITTVYTLQGLTTGVLAGECNRDPADMEIFEYEFVNSEFQMYLCDANAGFDTKGLVNTERGNGAASEDTVPIQGNLVFYKADEDTLCVFGSDQPGGESPVATFPDFRLPLPAGFSDVTDALGALPANIPRNFRAECTLNEDGSFKCDQAIALTIFADQVPVNPLTLTNGVENPVAPDCPDFGPVPDAENFEPDYEMMPLGSDEIQLVGWTEILESTNTKGFNIDGALVVAIIKARLVQ